MRLVVYGPVVRVNPGGRDKREVLHEDDANSVEAARGVFDRVAQPGSEAYVKEPAIGGGECIRAYWTK